MEPPNSPQDTAFRVALPAFEGPLDLLLHLARKHELDLLDLPIAFVTERYLEYLELMRELDLDVASEYLLMAATLAHIKSKLLLPPSPDEDDDEGDEQYMEDPRAELIKRLLEYQKYKHAAETLGDRAVAGRDVFTRGVPAPAAQGEAPLAEISLFKLLDALEGVMKRVQGKLALEVTAEQISIQERMTQITEVLRERRECVFEELFEGDRTRYAVVVTFLAILEMAKIHVLRLYQADVEAPIHVQSLVLDPSLPTVPPVQVEVTADAGAPKPVEPPVEPDEDTASGAWREATSEEIPADDQGAQPDVAELAPGDLDAAGLDAGEPEADEPKVAERDADQPDAAAPDAGELNADDRDSGDGDSDDER